MLYYSHWAVQQGVKQAQDKAFLKTVSCKKEKKKLKHQH